MVEIHLVLGVGVVASNLIAGLWGGASWLRQRYSQGFWYALRLAQAAVVIQVATGGLLFFMDHRPADDLHYLYGLLPLLVMFLGEGARAGAAQQEVGDLDFRALPDREQRRIALAILRRETGIMAVSAIVIFFISLRAAFTSAAF